MTGTWQIRDWAEWLRSRTTTVVAGPARVAEIRAALAEFPLVEVVESAHLPDPEGVYIFHPGGLLTGSPAFPRENEPGLRRGRFTGLSTVTAPDCCASARGPTGFPVAHPWVRPASAGGHVPAQRSHLSGYSGPPG